MLSLESLEKSLRRKELEAKKAKAKGMHTTYGNRMAEIIELKRKIDQRTMGSLGSKNFT